MQLLYSNCVPKLTFGAAVKELTSSEMNQFNVAVNTAARRIFGFRQWQSIRQIREVYGEMKWNENEFILRTHGGNDDFTIEFIGRITNKPLIQISS